jgi:hypothetical protein
MFIVVNLRTGKEWCNLAGETVFYATGDKAADAAKNLNLHSRWNFCYYRTRSDQYPGEGSRISSLDLVHAQDKWQVRPANKNENWIEDEQKKYKKNSIPWAKDPIWQEIVKSSHLEHHFPIWNKENNIISYFETLADGLYQRRRLLNVMKYLRKFVPSEYNEKLSEWAKQLFSLPENVEFGIVNTRAQIREIYENGPESCMKGKPTRWYKSKKAPHPAEVYASKDLGVAYIKRSGKYTARSVVWPDKSIYVRLYGDDSNLLKQALECNGYAQGNLEGANLLYIPADKIIKQPCTAIIPYIDGGCSSVGLSKDKKFLVVGENKSKASGKQAVYLDMEYQSHSGKTFNAFRDNPIEVYLSPRKSVIYSRSEIENENQKYFFCYQTNKTYLKEAIELVHIFNYYGERYAITKFDYNKRKKKGHVMKCDFYGIEVERDALFDVVVGYEKDGTPIVHKWIGTVPATFYFSYGKKYYANWLAVTFPGYRNNFMPLDRYQKTFPEKITKENAEKYTKSIEWNDTKKSWNHVKKDTLE